MHNVRDGIPSHPLPSVWSKLFHVTETILSMIDGHLTKQARPIMIIYRIGTIYWCMDDQAGLIRNVPMTFPERQTLNPTLSSDEA